MADEQSPTSRLRGVEAALFARACKSDREAAARYINRHLRSETGWSSKTLRERMQFVVDKYDEKIRTRERDADARCGRKQFPEQYDRVADLMWLVPDFAEYLHEPKKNGEKMMGIQTKPVADADQSDDSEAEDDEITVKKEVGEGGEDYDSAETASESESEDEDEIQKLHGKISQLTTRLDVLQKRKIPAPEPPSAKKVKTAHRRESTQKASSYDDENEEMVKRGKKIIFTAVSRGSAICSMSKAKRDRVLGWPSFKGEK